MCFCCLLCDVCYACVFWGVFLCVFWVFAFEYMFFEGGCYCIWCMCLAFLLVLFINHIFVLFPCLCVCFVLCVFIFRVVVFLLLLLVRQNTETKHTNTRDK